MLKPGGWLVTVDALPMAGASTEHLHEQGMKEVKDQPMDWHCWLGLPWVVRLIQANKPQ